MPFVDQRIYSEMHQLMYDLLDSDHGILRKYLRLLSFNLRLNIFIAFFGKSDGC